MKSNAKRYLGGVLTAAVFLAALGVALTVPPSAWQVVGERAALLSAGLREPGDSAQHLSGYFTRATAAAPTVAPTVQLGEAVTHPVTTTTTVIRKEGGTVLTQQLSAGSEFVQGVAIRNKSGKAVNIANSLSHVPKLSLTKTEAPQVLITHTHTTECYLPYDTGFYNNEDPTRTADETKNMVAVGKRVAARLTAAGIGVIHDTAIHDQPYNGAYGHSKAAIQQYLAKYPTIRVVLDLHRDAIYTDSTTHVKPTVVIDGKPAAQIMVLVGMKNTSSVPNPHTAENLALAVRLQQRLHQSHPGLARPLLLADGRYNQQLTNGSLLIEIGSDANTLSEACYSGDLLGDALATVLHSLGA